MVDPKPITKNHWAKNSSACQENKIMNDQELIKKLNILKEVKLESAWKQETRDVLLAQVSNSVGGDVKVGWMEIMAEEVKSAFSFMPATAWAVICLAIILTGGTFGAIAAKNSKPGDTLYIAKVWKEKIQVAMTFNQEDKAKLNMKLASIHAMEIADELSSPNFNAAGNQKKAQQLAQNFQQEINTVKEQYSEINKLQQNNSAPTAAGKTINNTSSNLAAADDNAEVGIGDVQKASDSKVYTVESGKDAKGMQFFDPNSGLKNATGTSQTVPKTGTAPTVSSNSVAVLASSTPVASSSVTADINTSLDKATQSFDTKDFSVAKDIMDQVGKIIENIDTGVVKGATESGTSTGGSNQSAVGSSSGK
jgi:Domain of unknown function (DUF5667)